MTLHHKRTRRTTLGVSVLAVSALTLAACSGDADDDNGSATAGDNGEPVSIEYWHRLPAVDGAKTVDEIVEEYNESQDGIEVTATAFQGAAADSYLQISSAVQAGNAACIAQVGVDRVPDLLSTGQLMDVTEYAGQYEDDYLEYAWGRATFDGATYGLPQDTGPIVYYYRTDLFEENGIEVPTTWDEFDDAAKAIKEADPDARIASFLPDEALWVMALASANGATWWDIADDGWSVDIDGEPTMEVADYWQGLIDDDLVHTTLRWAEEFNQQLDDGSLFGTIGASWEAPLIAASAPDTSGNWGVAQIPLGDPSNPMVGDDGGSIVAVLDGCEHPEEAVEFAQWLNTDIDDLMPLGLLPATQEESLETPADMQEFYGGQAIYDEFVSANDMVNPNWSFSPTTGAVMSSLQDDMGQMTIGETTLPEAITAAQDVSVSSLQDAGVTVNE